MGWGVLSRSSIDGPHCSARGRLRGGPEVKVAEKKWFQTLKFKWVAV